MKLEQQVCSLDLAQKLKELGVKQESFFFYAHRRGEKEMELLYPYAHLGLQIVGPVFDRVSAFTVAELGEMLPDYYLSKRIGMLRGAWACFDDSVLNRNSFNTRADTEADVRASMLVYLLENKII